jgi:hypothetical protein
LYGTSGADDRWCRDFLSWTDALRVQNAELLTTFTLARSELRKQVVLRSEALSDFIRFNQAGNIGFIRGHLKTVYLSVTGCLLALVYL